MKKLDFVKMNGTGNDFVVVDFRRFRLRQGFGGQASFRKLACFVCQRKTGIGADGILILEKSKKADFKMRIFNPDGSEAEMCGNGLRCAVRYAVAGKNRLKVETQAGIYEASVTVKDTVKIKMEEPDNLNLEMSIIVNQFLRPKGRSLFEIDTERPLPIRGLKTAVLWPRMYKRKVEVGYIDIGVPHAVIFVLGIDKIDVEKIGKDIRFHNAFKPRGVNVDFVEVIDDKNIKMRTYERGVEGETLACGTGAVASAIITSLKFYNYHRHEVNVHTKGGILKVSFRKEEGFIKDVYLEGEAKEVFRGNIPKR